MEKHLTISEINGTLAFQNVMLKETLTSQYNKKTQVKNKKIPLRLRKEKAQILFLVQNNSNISYILIKKLKGYI